MGEGLGVAVVSPSKSMVLGLVPFFLHDSPAALQAPAESLTLGEF